jgi:hypothetical protein
MIFLFCKHKVENFERWYSIFKSHQSEQIRAGLHLLYLLRDSSDPNLIVYFFTIENVERAKAFIETPEAIEAGKKSGVIGIPEINWMIEQD